MSDARPPHPVLESATRRELLALLRTTGRPMSVAEAARRVGLQVSTTRLHLDLLASAGLVERTAERRATVGRPRIHYAAARARGRASRDDFEGLAVAMAHQLSSVPDPAEAAREAGRRWTEALDVPADASPATPEAAVQAVVGLMDRLGFEPAAPDPGRVELRRCPFESIARQERGVVCGIHEGMLVETFRRFGGTVELAGLEPFAVDAPLLCVVHLRTLANGLAEPRAVAGREDNDSGARPARRGSGRVSKGMSDD